MIIVITAAEKYRAVLREIEMRKRVYPKRVEGGAMTQRQADHQIKIMEAIAADYQAELEREKLL